MQHRQTRGMTAFMSLMVFLSGHVFAEIDLRNATVERLDNGMTVILLEDRNFPVVSVQMLYRVGARDESYGQTGIAHFLEHMAFRDSADFPDTEVVSSIYARGGEWHGYTWTDQTTYFATVPKEHLDLLLRIEADRMTRLKISEDDMEAERGAVLAEMHSYENSPSSLLLDAIMATSFLAHPYRNNTIGWESDIDNMQHADVVRFYQRHYQPANAVLAVVGDFESAAVRARIEELFGDVEGRAPTPLPVTVEPVQQGERRVRLYGNTDRKHVKIAWRAPSVNSEDFATFLVLQEALGAGSGVNFEQNDWGVPVGEDSILHGAAENLTTWYPPSAQDYIFVIGGTTDVDTSESDIEQAIEKRLKSVRQNAPDKELIGESIDKVLDELVYDIATTEDAAHQLAFFSGLNALDKFLKLPELVAAVDAAAVQRVARTYLVPRRRTIGWYMPDEHPETQVAVPVVPAADMHPSSEPQDPVDAEPVPLPVTSKLKAGIPVVVQQSDMSPTVYLQVVLQGEDITGEGIEANVPARGYSSLTWYGRPAGLQNAILNARKAIDDATIESDSASGPFDDPETRLDQAFAGIMSDGQNQERDSVAPALIVMSGDVDQDRALALLDAQFGDLHAASQTAAPVLGFEPDEVEIALGHPIAQAQLGYIVPAPGPGDERSHAWRLLLYIVSHGYEGRLGKEAISNRGLAYYIGSRYRSDGTNGWVTLSVGVDPEKVAPLKDLMKAEFERLRDEPPTSAEIDEAKSYLVGRAQSSAQSNEELATALAEEWLWYGATRSPEELAEELSAVSQDDVQEVISEFVNGTTIVVTE